jgi:hypothetical protein
MTDEAHKSTSNASNTFPESERSPPAAVPALKNDAPRSESPQPASPRGLLLGRRHRRWIAALALLCVSAVVTLWISLAVHMQPAWTAYVLAGLAVMQLLAAGLAMRKRLPPRAVIRRSLQARRAAIDEARREVEAAKARVDRELRAATERLAEREQQLNHRLTTFHEWMEFPQPANVEREASQEPCDSADELAEKDKKLLLLLERHTETLFDSIQQNRYVLDGQFQPRLLRDDAIALIHDVAHLYQPMAMHPLLETSLEQILRSGSRICLQLLIVMERLPLNVKQYNLNSLYRYIRQAVRAYDMYKAAEPFWPYLNTAYYLGRAAMGANPVALGAWWFLGQHGKRLAGELTTSIVQRQVLTLLRDMVRVVGYEAAAVYGGDFRHRDPNWIYGVELVELMRCVHLAPKSFSCALQEVGALELRGEYDRIFLYRCLGAGQSADPARYRATAVLTSSERQAIAHRLETFASSFRLRGTEQVMAEWVREVESRLDVKLHIGSTYAATTAEQQQRAVRSLASYMLEVKQREPQELPEILRGCRLLARMAPELRKQVLDELQEQPPFFFEPPEIEPDGEIATVFLDDLIQLAVHTPPHLAQLDVVLANTAAFLRRDPETVHQRVDDACRRLLRDRCSSPNCLPARLPADVVRAILDLLGEGEKVSCIFGKIRVEDDLGQPAAWAHNKGQLWLVGIAQRLVLFAIRNDVPRLLWTARQPVRIECVDGWLSSDCRVYGGEWADEAWTGSHLLLSTPRWKRPDESLDALRKRQT